MNRASSNGGFSLPEVLVALAVFGIMGGALSSLLLLNMNWNRIAKEITTATGIAQDRIEAFRTSITKPSPVGTNVIDTVTRDGLSYTRKWIATDPNGTNGLPSGTSEIAVTVSWREPEPQSVTLRTYVSY